MADPDAVDLDININVGLEGVEKLNKLQNKVEEMQNSVGSGFSEVTESASEAAEEMGNVGGQANEARTQFVGLTGVGLGMLFLFRQLAQPFQKLVGQMSELGGVSDELGGIMAGPLAKGGQMIRDALPMELISNFVEEHESLIAKLIIVAAVSLSFVSALGMVVAFFAAASAAGFGFLTALAALIGAALAPLIFLIGVELGKAFTDFMMWAAETENKVVSAFRSILSFITYMLIGGFWALVNELTGVRGKIISLMGDVVDYLLGDFITDIKNIGIVGALKNAFEAGKDKAIEIVKDLADRVKGLIPDIDMDVPGSGVVSSGVSALRGNDFVMQGGKVVRANPDDTILGFKGDQDGMGGQTVNNIEIEMDASIDSRMDVEKVVDEVERKIDRRTGGRSTIR